VSQLVRAPEIKAMPLKHPDELLLIFAVIIKKVEDGQPLDPSMSPDLWDIYNYFYDLNTEPSFTRGLHAQSAHRAGLQEQLAQDRKLFNDHKQFIENNFDKADQYLRTIQLGGYAAFFAVWGLTRDWLVHGWSVIAVLLMLVSATVFVAWEIFKSTLLVRLMKHHASISSGGLEKFVHSRLSTLSEDKSLTMPEAKWCEVIWLICVGTTAPSLFILI
jgi:hypothetical protein